MASQRPDEEGHIPSPFSLRFSRDERARLERDAAGMSLGGYIRWRLFEPDKPPPRHRNKFPVKDHVALAGVLAKLGNTRLASNVHQLAHAANIGALFVTPETEAELCEATREIKEMRRMLVQALGLSDGPA